MSKAKKIGTIFILAGICLSLVGFFSAYNYTPLPGLIYNIHNMKIRLAEARYDESVKGEWKYMTGEEIVRHKVILKEKSEHEFVDAWDLYMYNPRTIAETIDRKFHTNLSLDEIEKKVIAGERIKVSERVWIPGLEINYSSVLIICIVLVVIGIGFIALSRGKKETTKE